MDEREKPKESSDIRLEDYLADISKVFISFTKISKRKCEADIYSGNEEIPFKERDPRYKAILMQEFLNNFKKPLKIKTNFKGF